MSLSSTRRAYFHPARCAFQRRAAYRLANWSGITPKFSKPCRAPSQEFRRGLGILIAGLEAKRGSEKPKRR